MSSKTDVLGAILQGGLLPNLIHDRLDPFRAVAEVRAVGIRAVEVSCRRPDTLELLVRLKREFPDMFFGVSSLVDDGAYHTFLRQRGPRFPAIAEAVDAGADFLVSVFDFSEATYRRYPDTVIIPAVSTLNEARRQLDLGANLIKFCAPALAGGPAFYRQLVHCAPAHWGIPILLTGGLRPALIDDYVAAGMLVCVCGFDLILSEHYLAMQDDFQAPVMRDQLNAYVAAFSAARQQHLPGVDFAGGDARRLQDQTGRCLNV